MRIRTIIAAALAGAFIILSACSSNNQQTADAIPASAMSLNEQIAFSKKDLAQRHGEKEDAIVLVGARYVTWRSGALGCPEPGGFYTQALVPGVLILLRSGAETFGYHASEGGRPFYCPGDRVESPATMETEDLA